MKNINEIINIELDEYGINTILSESIFIENEIEKIFNQIKMYSFEFAQSSFDLLDNIQTLLAKIAFREHKSLTTKLKKFVHDFDRLDDMNLRKYMYSKIVEGKYRL